MGSGLILGGIGKGIAEAGAAYAGGMSKMAEFEMQQQREDMREERQLRLAEKMATQKEERESTKHLEIGKRADEAPLKREAAAVVSAGSKVEGESPVMSKEEVLQLIKDNPQYREVYRKAGLIGEDKIDPSVRRAMDEEAAAREVGAPASMVEGYRKSKIDMLARIKEEARQAHTDVVEQQGQQRLDILARGMTAKENRANQPAADKPITGVDLERTAKAAERALAMHIGVPVKDVPETIARLRKQNKMDSETQGYLDEYTTSLKEWQGYKRKPKDVSDNVTPTSAPAKPAAVVPDLPKGAIQIGTSGGKAVYQTPDGKKFIAN